MLVNSSFPSKYISLSDFLETGSICKLFKGILLLLYIYYKKNTLIVLVVMGFLMLLKVETTNSSRGLPM